MTTALQLAQPYALTFTPEQEDMIRAKYAPGASPAEFAVLMEIAKTRSLNPITAQIYFIPRAGKWSVQVSIDGLRSIAQRTGLYAGQDEPEWLDDDKGRPIRCTVKVYRKDWERPAVGVAYFAEYSAGGSFWTKMPHLMLSKVAEALALRKAFPEDTGGLYTNDEMDQADSGPTHVQAQPPKLIAATQAARKVVPYNPAERPSWLSDEGETLLDFIEGGSIEAIRTELKGQIAKCELGEEELAVLRGALDWRLSKG